jgi:hypothetical protein
MVKPEALWTLVQRVMWTPIPRTITKPAAAKLVLVGVALHADPSGGSAYPSRERLASLCELSPRTLDRVLQDLAGVGLLAEQAPPSFTRPRTWRVDLAALAWPAACGRFVENSAGFATPPAPAVEMGGSERQLSFRGWQIDATATDIRSFVSYRFATDQVQVQEQVQNEERAPAADATGSPDQNYRVILKLAHTVLDVVGVRASLGDVVDAVKERCARAHIDYWPGDVVQRAVAAALVQRVGRPADPLAIRDLRRLRQGRSS